MAITNPAQIQLRKLDSCGRELWRVMRLDGDRRIFDANMLDFDSEGEALLAIDGEFRRKKLGPYLVVS